MPKEEMIEAKAQETGAAIVNNQVVLMLPWLHFTKKPSRVEFEADTNFISHRRELFKNSRVQVFEFKSMPVTLRSNFSHNDSLMEAPKYSFAYLEADAPPLSAVSSLSQYANNDIHMSSTKNSPASYHKKLAL